MPTALRRLFGIHDSLPTKNDAAGTLRALLAVLRQPSQRRRFELTVRLLRRAQFQLALVVEAVEDAQGSLSATVSTGSVGDLDPVAVNETLASRISPLLGMNTETPRWLDLHGDPFGPGSAFLRKFGLASAVVLPLGRPGPDLPLVPFLLLATREPLAYQDRQVQELLLAWNIYRAAGPSGGGPLVAGAATPISQLKGMNQAWETAPVALAVVNGDEVQAANRTAHELLSASVGKDGRSWQLWLAAAVRRLESSDRRQEKLLASRDRHRSLAVALGPRLAKGRGRVVAVRDATEEMMADSRHAETVTTLSHELRTPLASMKNSVSLILRREAGELTADQDRFLSLTMRNIDRLDRLIGDLLDVSRAAAGRLSLRRQLVDLGPLLREALDMHAATAQQRSITLDFSGLPASFPAHVDGDKVVQMIHNTVGNALKYTEESGYVRVWLMTRQGELPALVNLLAERFFLPLRTFTLVVEDNGMGMSEDVLNNLFRPFRRGPEAEARREPGSGLGLHITRALVEAHGGGIKLASDPDVGTTVWILLPRDPESERVLVAARRLERHLAAAGDEARLICLDARRPDRELEEQDVRKADQAVRQFVMRMTSEDGTGLPARALDLTAGLLPGQDDARSAADGVVSLADGLWIAVLANASRIGPAWEVARAKPGCPYLLEGSEWEVVTSPRQPAADAPPPEERELVPEGRGPASPQTEEH